MEANRQKKKSNQGPNEKKPAADANNRPNVKNMKNPPQKPQGSQKNQSLSRKNAGTNCSQILAAINATEETNCRPETAETNTNDTSVKKSRNRRKKDQRVVTVAIDCEMVGVGPMGNKDMLARVSIVNKNGDILLDEFVRPRHPVTDYRTDVSGIRPQDIEHGEEFEKVQDKVVELLQGKILVGHAVRYDLSVLYVRHPFLNIRDTSTYKPLARLVSNGRTPSLKRLSQAILGIEIQTGEHNSVEDARAAMNIYNRLSADWEKYIHKQKRSK